MIEKNITKLLYGTMDNREARLWYLQHLAQIPNLLNESLSLKEQSIQASELRNQFRATARLLMKDRETAEYLEQIEPNMSWEVLYDKYKSGLKTDEEIYQIIIEKSQSSREAVNTALGLSKEEIYEIRKESR